MLKNALNEFKKFALKGNVLDMAVGIIIGASFSKIVDSLVKDILMPPLGLLLGKVDFSNLYIKLLDGSVAGPYASLDAAQKAGAITINYGVFLNALISFTIVAFAVFLLIKAINALRERMEEKEEKAPLPPSEKVCPYCCSKIPVGATRCPCCTSELKKQK